MAKIHWFSYVVVIFGFLLGFLGTIALATTIFWLLWNWIAPLFGGPTLTFWQTLGLCALLRILADIFRFVKSK